MARQPKKGLSYFPTDVDWCDDFKIIDLLERYGPQGTTVYQILLTLIYKNGYYLDMPLDKVSLILVRKIGSKWINKERAAQVIHYCAEIGLFDNDLLSQGVLTSVGIQLRYEEITARNKSDKSLYWLLDTMQPLENVAETPQNVAETPQNVAETPVSVTEMQQIKENKIKQKETETNKKIYIVEIVDYLNKKTGARYNPKTRDTVSHINARLNEGYTVEQFKQVIDKKCADWLNNPQMREYLRPATLFCTKFESYLNSAITAKATDKTDPTNYYGDDDSEEFLKQYG